MKSFFHTATAFVTAWSLLALTALPVGWAADIDAVTEIQTFSTSGGMTDWEPFEIGGQTYMVHGRRTTGDAKVYQWNGSAFTDIQTIATGNAFDWEHFTIGSDDYLVVANTYDGSFNTTSKIYKWDGAQFVEFQSIATNAPYDWEYFTIGADHYLAVANSYDGSSRAIASKIYKWDGTQFSLHQDITTIGALAWEHFEIAGETYLVVANGYDGSTNNIDSRIYKWNGTQFNEVQAIATSGARAWTHFTIGSDTYLAVANSNNSSTVNIDSKIYRWDGTQFVEFQSIPTSEAYHWEHFTLDGDTYLAVANNYNGTTATVGSPIYQWDGTQFVFHQSTINSGIHDYAFFTIGTDAYLAAANEDGDSKLYQLEHTASSGSGSGDIEAKVNIQEGEVTIGAPSLIQFPDTGVSDAEQTVNVTVTDHFFVKDLKAAAAGYFTTLSVSDMVDGSKTIAADNMEIRVENGTVEALEGTADPNVTVPTATQTYTQFTSSSPVTLLQRSTNSSGLVGKYGVLPDFQLTIPAYQSLGSYTATMTYTLIEN